jgi:hypothetical protein
MAFTYRGVREIGHVFQFVEAAVFPQYYCFHCISPLGDVGQAVPEASAQGA